MIDSLLILLVTSSTVTVSGCPEADEIQRLARMELSAAEGAASIRCEGDRAVLTYGERTRSVDLGPVAPKARARLLALALAELANQVEPPPPPVSPPAPATGAKVDASVEILGGFATFSAASPFSFGGRAGFEVAGGGRFGGRLDLGASFGSGSIPGGRASMLAVAGGITGFARFPAGALEIDLGAGGRVGWIRLAGAPEDPEATAGATVAGVWGGPHAAARLALPLDTLALLIDLEAGLVLRPVVGRAEGAPAIAADGAWFAVHAGAGFGL